MRRGSICERPIESLTAEAKDEQRALTFLCHLHQKHQYLFMHKIPEQPEELVENYASLITNLCRAEAFFKRAPQEHPVGTSMLKTLEGIDGLRFKYNNSNYIKAKLTDLNAQIGHIQYQNFINTAAFDETKRQYEKDLKNAQMYILTFINKQSSSDQAYDELVNAIASTQLSTHSLPQAPDGRTVPAGSHPQRQFLNGTSAKEYVHGLNEHLRHERISLTQCTSGYALAKQMISDIISNLSIFASAKI